MCLTRFLFTISFQCTTSCSLQQSRLRHPARPSSPRWRAGLRTSLDSFLWDTSKTRSVGEQSWREGQRDRQAPRRIAANENGGEIISRRWRWFLKASKEMKGFKNGMKKAWTCSYPGLPSRGVEPQSSTPQEKKSHLSAEDTRWLGCLGIFKVETNGKTKHPLMVTWQSELFGRPPRIVQFPPWSCTSHCGH